jgi:hypothetical protein
MSNEVKAANIFNPEMLLDLYNTYVFLTPHHQMRGVMREAVRLFPTSIVTSLHSEGFIKLEEAHGMDIPISKKQSISEASICFNVI